jgi:toxin-antitoxin system PIN domain toxin
MTDSAAVPLDSNALVALAISSHEHHVATSAWLDDARFATCPITEGALIRIVTQYPGGTARRAAQYLREVTRSDRHEFWPDQLSYLDVPVGPVVGHRQVTDAYLAQLARSRASKLATLDKVLAALHSDVAELVPTS